jgi:hypothetical protein
MVRSFGTTVAPTLMRASVSAAQAGADASVQLIDQHAATDPLMRLACALGVLVTALVLAGAAQAQSEERELPALAPAPDDALTDALESGELTEAEYALERAQSLFQLGKVRREFGDVERAGPRDATLTGRDLALRLRFLRGADRALAERILSRPDDGNVVAGHAWNPAAVRGVGCFPNVCVNWVETTPDAPPGADGNPLTVPQWVFDVLEAWQDAWDREIVGREYYPPLSDATSSNAGFDDRLDVYIEDLGVDGLFGYCWTDDPGADDPTVFAVSAYCVVDDDYAPSQYGNEHTPNQYLDVTSAHEFHHTSQFAYDFLEDGWLMEGTATNMEEELWPDISDNVNFLRDYSPLNRPSSPLDRSGLFDSEYGAWIFFRFLQDKVAGGNHAINREIWERADASPNRMFGDQYSLQAVESELRQRGYDFADVFARFGRTNRLLSYSDNAISSYPRVPITFSRMIGRQSPRTRVHSWKVNHLATRYFSFTPGRRVSSKAKLAIRVVLPARGTRFMRASVMVIGRDNSVAARVLRGKNGLARTTTRFSRRTVKRVDVVLSNGSTRTSCGSSVGPPYYSCLGDPKDDGRVFKLSAALR